MSLPRLCDETIKQFVEANASRLYYLKDKAYRFVNYEASKFPEENVVISFSGGRDSTATADIVIKSLSNSSLVHILGDTTLEFPYTTEFANRYRNDHPQAIFKVARNNEQVFLDVCEDIGPPARMMRWCCSMFKTGPITRVINSLYRNQQILTFYGIRKSESVSRSKYNRVEDDAGSVKIQQQTVASPIFFWKDMDVWLYLFAEGVDFNEAYRLGYDRVECWCCPNNNQRDVKIKFSNCTSEEHAKIYRLVRPFDDELVGMLVPFGRVAPELGQKLLHEIIVLDLRTNVPILSIQPFEHDGYNHAVKIRTMNVADHEDLQRMWVIRYVNLMHAVSV